MKYLSRQLIVVFILVGIGAAQYLWLQYRQREVPIPRAPQVEAPPAAIEPVAPASSGIQHPIEALQSEPAVLPSLGDSDSFVKAALNNLLGSKAVLAFLSVDDFIRHFVVTVDNLARGEAASHLWPVLPTPGRIVVVEYGDGTHVADGNAERFTPFVKLAQSVDSTKAAALYQRLYPLCQQAYEELGYPGKYFNDRLIEIIDQLLETPELKGPIKLTLTDVQGPIPATRPWLRYEFADPDLESLPAGQKILLRMGAKNAQALKAKLREFRERIAIHDATR